MAYRLTKKQILAEIVKSGKDPAYFINNYCRISHPIDGLIPFRTYPYQDDMLQNFNDHRFNIILKARQLGLSTIVAAYVVWLLLFHRDKNVLVIATKFATATNLVKKVKAIMKNLPEWLRIADIKIDNRSSFELSNGSQIKAGSTSGDAGRSEALSLLVVDEAAHVDGLDELWTGLYPTLSTGGRCIALSTPNGVGNWFHKTYINAEEGENDFFASNLPWDVHPERDKIWFEKETRNMSRRQIAQELECNFNTSGETVIHPDDIAIVKQFVRDPNYRTGFDRNYWIWEEKKPNEDYLIVADVARGDGKDSSAFHVFKISTMEQVAEYQGKPSLDMYSNILYQVGKEYGDALLVVENIGIGISVLEKLELLGYTRLYYSLKGSHEYIEQQVAYTRDSSVPGFSTTVKTRPLIVAKMEEFIRNKLIILHSSRLVNEMSTFIWRNGKAQAMKGYNDDLVMSFAIACWVRDTALTANEKEQQYTEAFFNALVASNRKFDTTIPGMLGHNRLDNKLAKEVEKAKHYMWLMKG
ncbi:MAG: hypothetical protein CME38_12165 [Haliea sp.]|nr:hypothetical protein [Haliea sp.]|tara:strand:- start:825 stop:2405 length:1581 start_codon:yes stop_codon:yes gene_type:complete